jgi:tetratricopeptide (TPR) repeat protein
MSARQGLVRRVIEGANGRLFLGEQDGFSIESFLWPGPFGVGRTELWRRTLRRRARELKARGVSYVVMVVPDAHYLYRDDLPPEFALEPKAPGQRWLELMSELRDITFVDPRRELSDASGLLEVYRKTDSHWSSYGAFVGYRALVRELGRLMPVSPLAAREVAFEFRSVFGDLGVSVVPERGEETPLPALRRSYEKVYENVGLRRLTHQETFASQAPAGRVLFDRDSAFNAMFDYVACSVRHMACYGTTSSFYLDAVDRFEPDVVVSEIGERRLALFESDHLRDGFDDIFRADFSSPRGRKIQTALFAMRDGNIERARLVAGEFELHRDLDPDHAYVLAQILHADGEFARADETIDAALTAYPQRPSFLSLKASVALSAGDFRVAAAFADRALALAPYNGYHHQIHASVLLNRGEPDAARRHLDGVLREIDDARVLFYLHSLACGETGDRIGAIESILQALVIDPYDPAFKERAIRLLQP